MSDQGYQFTARGLIVVPGLDYTECEGLFETAAALHQQARWSLGDAAVYAYDMLGEVAAQFVGDYAPEAVREAMRVCRRIELPRRRFGLSFSLHQAVAYCTRPEQDRLLDEAERLGWRSADMRAAVKARRTPP